MDGNYFFDTELTLIAKASGAEEKCRKVSYIFLTDSSYPSLSVSKRDIMLAQLYACERLLRHTKDRMDRLAIDLEITELNMALDLLP